MPQSISPVGDYRAQPNRRQPDVSTAKTDRSKPYGALAPIYDEVMAHVDYEDWANHLLDLLARHVSTIDSVIELGCGTGNLTTFLYDQLDVEYLASDGSPEMLEFAKRKIFTHAPGPTFCVIDFVDFTVDIPFDVAILGYDGVNYLITDAEIDRMFGCVSNALNKGGLFLFDQTTPANSINNLPYFEDALEADTFSYERTSTYDAKHRLHTTKFLIALHDGPREECHVQRAFTRMEMAEAVSNSGFEVLACQVAFDFEPADDETERIQWVLRKR